MTLTQINSYAAIAVGVLVPVVTMVTPALQQAAAANPVASAGVAFGLALWNHFAVPFWKANQPKKP